MSSDEDSRGDPTWIPYAERPEWKDVTPVAQMEHDFEVVKIAYTDKCKPDLNEYIIRDKSVIIGL